MKYTAAVITMSDKGSQGLREDTSGPAVQEILKENGWEVVYTNIIPDDFETIKSELIKCADELDICLVMTTGGTGFSRRDVTPEATHAVCDREVRGIPEAMRAESMKITPMGMLSRAEAGLRGGTLIVNLPGSKKAATECLNAVIKPIKHGVEVLRGTAHDCAEMHKKNTPSIDAWLAEAKQHESAPLCGMYLTHNGVVRETAKAKVRSGQEDTKPVVGMHFSYDREKLDAVIEETYKMEGIYYIKTWLAEGELKTGDDIMYVLIGGDIRPHIIDALQYLVGRIKNECVEEVELYE